MTVQMHRMAHHGIIVQHNTNVLPFLKFYRFQKALYYPYSIHNDSYFPLVQNAVLVLERLVDVVTVGDFNME
jgi:hypothetical protein